MLPVLSVKLVVSKSLSTLASTSLSFDVSFNFCILNLVEDAVIVSSVSESALTIVIEPTFLFVILRFPSESVEYSGLYPLSLTGLSPTLISTTLYSYSTLGLAL